MARVFISFCFVFFSMACSKQSTKAVPGLTSEAELIALLGQPTREAKSENRRTKTLYYDNQRTAFQIHQEKVNQIYRNPKQAERKLSYWIRKWQGEPKYFRPIAPGDSKEKRTLYQVYLPNRDLSLMVDTQFEKVIRIVEHPVGQLREGEP
jgi:hypothetical protein